MSNIAYGNDSSLILGVEGGGTRTVAILADDRGRLIRRAEFGPANVRLLSDTQLRKRFRELKAEFSQPQGLAICLAGARDERDRSRIVTAASKIWPDTPCRAATDLDGALAAATMQSSHARIPRVLILSGTGSCCFGRDPNGHTAKIGGWGHLLGDKGSGYEIGLRALKAVVFYLDRDGTWSALGQRLLRALQLNEPNDLIDWVRQARKEDIAALAIEVFAAWSKRDRIASDVLAGAADSLAKDAVNCARQLAKPGRSVEFVMAGSVLLRQPRFARLVAARIKHVWRESRCVPLRIESVWGAVSIAREQLNRSRSKVPTVLHPSVSQASRRDSPIDSERQPFSETAEELSPTEERNPRSHNLHKLSLSQGIQLMLEEESGVPQAVLKERAQIERALRLIVRALRGGGRLFYVGAGTSGRLGVLDASECPPTFRTPPDMVQGIIAGGHRALYRSMEGAEDDSAAGASAVRFRGVTAKDVVVGIAASGRTPFVREALREARQQRAKTVLVCFNPKLRIPRRDKPDVVIAPEVGPEILTGSTRLKCGTATKLILNIFTTLAMVKLGKVSSNLMIDLHPSNQKLRDRATRMVCELTGWNGATARGALERCHWHIKEVLKQKRPAAK